MIYGELDLHGSGTILLTDTNFSIQAYLSLLDWRDLVCTSWCDGPCCNCVHRVFFLSNRTWVQITPQGSPPPPRQGHSIATYQSQVSTEVRLPSGLCKWARA